MFVTKWPLSSTDPEYKEAAYLFNKGAKTKDFALVIDGIEKVQNNALLQKFEEKKIKYRSQYGHVQVVKVFHGTKRENISSILRNNLDRHRHGQNRGHRFGAGVSFSAISNYSSHYCDEDEQIKQMLLCWVLVSNIVEVPEMKKKRYTLQDPPYIENSWPPIRYDTTAKNKSNMDVIVKFEDDTFYPAFVISFRKKTRQSIAVSPQPALSNFQLRSLPTTIENQSNYPFSQSLAQGSSRYCNRYSTHPRHNVPVPVPVPVLQSDVRCQSYVRSLPQRESTGLWGAICALARRIFGNE